MPSVDVVDLNNAVVGSVDLADEVFAAPVNEDLLYEAVRHSQAGGAAETPRLRRGTKFPVPAKSCGGKKEPAGRVWVRSARHCGGTAGRCMGRNRATIATNFRARCCWARCARLIG